VILVRDRNIQIEAAYATEMTKKTSAVCLMIGESNQPDILSKPKWVLFRFSNSPYHP